MKVFAKFDEIPSMILEVIKETKLYGHTFVRTVVRTDNVKTVYPPTNTVCGGINIAKSEKSSHTPGGCHHRPYQFNWKEKWTNKGTDKQYVAEFFYTQYNLSYLVFVLNFKILGKAVPEKSLTKISIFITLEIEKKEK